MCFVCENINRKDEFQYDYAIISYDDNNRLTHKYAIRYFEKSDEYILYVCSDDDADMQIIPILYCPFCGRKLEFSA